MIRRSLLMDEVKQELADGGVLIHIRGWYWLLDNEGRSRKVNCNSAKALIASQDLDEWRVEAWTGDRTFAAMRTKPWPSELGTSPHGSTEAKRTERAAMTLKEFKNFNEGKGESVMQLASFATLITDDDELMQAGQEAINAEQRFEYLLEQRNFDRG